MNSPNSPSSGRGRKRLLLLIITALITAVVTAGFKTMKKDGKLPDYFSVIIAQEAHVVNNPVYTPDQPGVPPPPIKSPSPDIFPQTVPDALLTAVPEIRPTAGRAAPAPAPISRGDIAPPAAPTARSPAAPAPSALEPTLAPAAAASAPRKVRIPIPARPVPGPQKIAVRGTASEPLPITAPVSSQIEDIDRRINQLRSN